MDENIDDRDEMQKWLTAGYWRDVSSTNVAKIRYRSWDRVLEVEFKSGWAYEYHEVPYEVARAMYLAESKGKFIHYRMKGNFRYSRVK